MVRLIDADALDYALGASDEDIYFHHMLEDAPTIDAVPVEWLEDKELDYRTTGDKMFSDAFAVVIGEWQNEQEART